MSLVLTYSADRRVIQANPDLVSVYIDTMGKIIKSGERQSIVISITMKSDKPGFWKTGHHYYISDGCLMIRHVVSLNKTKRHLLYKRLRSYFSTQQDWKLFCKKCEQAIFHGREKDWEEVVPENVAKAAWKVFNDSDEGCKDNLRVALMGNAPQMRRYMRQRKTGCCGFADYRMKIDGKYYAIGFNYGH